MHGPEKSDPPIVAGKSANKAASAAAEPMEPRGGIAGKAGLQSTVRTWEEYAVDLETRLADLHDRLHRGAYRALPSRRRYIPKPDGGRRPLGIAALEDKIVQTA